MYIPHNSTRLVEEWAPPSRGLSQAPTQAAADPQANYLDFYHCGKGFAYSQTSYKWKLNMDCVWFLLLNITSGRLNEIVEGSSSLLFSPKL